MRPSVKYADFHLDLKEQNWLVFSFILTQTQTSFHLHIYNVMLAFYWMRVSYISPDHYSEPAIYQLIVKSFSVHTTIYNNTVCKLK